MPTPNVQAGLAPPPGALAPPLRRRLACFLYEGVLLFGVVFVCALIYSVLTDQRHAMVGRLGLLLTAFVLAPGVYFTWYWSGSGQTLPMQTWRIHLQTADGRRLTRARALGRYLTAWIWFLPALTLAWLAGWHDSGTHLAAVLAAGVALYALSSKLHPQRQFWHDALCGTRLVDTRGAPPARA
ncbi:putative membrane protein [Methylibium petroleiphilum PM1]|uniref:Putative membrane protein n=1 Tax=Methylibium petroleiphilum (strain ATCC BAA-1232 / LMG 22953 / PM1) TaxID=420662 RepID=A2SHM6_METPP|nr:putative membrane protein [Methylibium petroleiphilum PM1]